MRRMAVLGAVLSGTILFSRPGRAQSEERQTPPTEAPLPSLPAPLVAPNVTDPLLAPVPSPKTLIRSWGEALERVRQQSLDLRQSLAQIESARGRARSTLAGALPKLTGTANLSHQLIVPQLDPTATGVAGFFPATALTGQLSLLVPLIAARNWYDYGTDLDGIRKSEADLAEVERKVLAGLAESLVTVYTSERLVEVSQIALRAELEQLELTKRRLALGSLTQLDVLRLEQEVNRARSQVISATETLRRNREALGRALGASEEFGVAPQLSLDQLWLDARSTCKPVSVFQSRTDVVAARAAEKLAERKRKAVWYSYVPTLSAQSVVTASTNSFATGSRGPVGWSIGGVLTWNLYDGGARYGEAMQAEAGIQQARASTEALQRQAELEWTQSERAIRVSEENLNVATKQLGLASESLRLLRAKFAAGSATSLELVETERAFREAQLDVTLKEFEVLRAKVTAFLARSTCDI